MAIPSSRRRRTAATMRPSGPSGSTSRRVAARARILQCPTKFMAEKLSNPKERLSVYREIQALVNIGHAASPRWSKGQAGISILNATKQPLPFSYFDCRRVGYCIALECRDALLGASYSHRLLLLKFKVTIAGLWCTNSENLPCHLRAKNLRGTACNWKHASIACLAF